MSDERTMTLAVEVVGVEYDREADDKPWRYAAITSRGERIEVSADDAVRILHDIHGVDAPPRPAPLLDMTAAEWYRIADQIWQAINMAGDAARSAKDVGIVNAADTQMNRLDEIIERVL